MVNFATKSLAGKFVTIFTPVVLICAGSAGILVYYMVQSTLVTAEYQKLDSIRTLKAERVRDYIHLLTDNALFLAGSARTRGAFERMLSQGDGSVKRSKEGAEKSDASGTSGPVTAKDKSDLAVKQVLDDFFAVNGADHGYEDCLLIDAKQGRVFVSYKNLADVGADVRTGSLKDSGLAYVFDRVMKTSRPVLSDIRVYPVVSAPAAFCGAPVFGKERNLLGVLVLRINTREIDEIMQLSDSAGATTAAYLVGPDLLLRSQPRSHKDAQILKTKVDTEYAKLALKQKDGNVMAKDYRGDLRFLAYGSIMLSKSHDVSVDFDWAIIVGIDRNEAIRPVISLGYRVLSIALAAGLIASIVAFVLARSVTKPVLALAGQATRISEGDLTLQLQKLTRSDEVGILHNAFKNMVDSLRTQIRQTLDGVSVLTSSAAEISATASQLATSTNITSSAVTETSSTVEEVKQAARVSSEKAKSVSASSKNAVLISERGKKATDETIQKMNVIKEQMESVGETVVKLSEHSRAIEDIVSTVQDLADQSNLLAVNASIEAARARRSGQRLCCGGSRDQDPCR